MLKLAVLLLSVMALNAMTGSNTLEELQPLWGVWKQSHNKVYSHASEESARQAIFAENYKKIHNFNRASDNIKLALNKFGDLTAGEFKALYTGYVRQQPRADAQDQPAHLRGFLASSDKIEWELLGLPSSVDWREKGAVTDVKNQGQCGSCWSFSTTGALEALYFINHGKLLSFSEQQLVDCDRASQDAGCNGGLPEDAFEYTAKKGLETEQDYPYSAADGTCKYDASKAVKVNSGHKAITPKSASALKAALTVQPVSIGIEADEQVFQFYSTGVVTKNCGDNLDHAVLVVGYTIVGSEEAFIVKNSWGPEWGNQGYIYVSTDGKANGGNGVCGILGDPVVPTA